MLFKAVGGGEVVIRLLCGGEREKGIVVHRCKRRRGKGEEGIDAIKDKIIEAIGADGFAKVAAMASKYAIPALAAVAIIYGGKKIWDYLSSVGDQEELATESATAGATASASIAGVANPIAANAKIKRDKNGVPIAPQKKNKDGTAVNALDIKNNIMGGKAIKRVQ